MQNALEVSVSLIRFPPGATGARAEVFTHQIDVAVEAVGWRDRGTHTLLRYYKGEENGAGSGGIKGVGRVRSANSGSEPATIQIFACSCLPLEILVPEEKGPSSNGDEPGPRGYLRRARGRRENLALATMFLRDGLLAPVAGLEPATH